jgi:hypothetical protein
VQTVEIKLWDDLAHHQSKDKVPADVQVELTYKTKKSTRHVRLDLSEQHGEELDALLAPYLEAGRGAGAPPEFHHGFRPGSKEARDYRQALRDWADSEDRTGEYLVKNPEVAKKNRFTYPLQLVQDFEAHLVALAENAA